MDRQRRIRRRRRAAEGLRIIAADNERARLFREREAAEAAAAAQARRAEMFAMDRRLMYRDRTNPGAAPLIQRVTRGWLDRIRAPRAAASTKIQALFRGHKERFNTRTQRRQGAYKKLQKYKRYNEGAEFYNKYKVPALPTKIPWY